MEYYDVNDDLIYHRCVNCSLGRAIPAADRREGFKTGAERCHQCRSKGQSGTCTEDDGEAEDQADEEDEDEDK